MEFASLDDTKGDLQYQAGKGKVIYDEEGQEHVIKHDGVARHLGDKGMKYIAEQIFDCIV